MFISIKNKTTRVIVLWMIFLLVSFSCKKDETTSSSEKGKDMGIHEKIDRGPASVIVDIDRKEISIAERLHLTLTVIVDEDYEIKLPAFGEKLEQFGIIDYHTTLPELMADNRKKVSRSYELEPFLSGEYTIPPMEIGFWKTRAQEAAAHKIETPEITITVKSLLPEDLKDFKLNEIKPPVDFPHSYALWLWVGIASIAAGVVVAALVMIKKRKKREMESSGFTIAAHEAAYEELRKLIAEDLPGQGRVKLFYQRISGILRRYIEDRFGLHAPEQTTEEFLSELERSRDFAAKYQSLLKTFLYHCDLVKFAQHQPQLTDIQNTFDSCKAFIEQTKDEHKHAF